ETAPRGGDQALVARAALLGAAVAAGATPPDHAAVVELLEGFETRYPEAKELHPRALELRLVARIARGELDRAGSDLDAIMGLRGAARAAAAAGDRAGALAYWRKVLEASTEGGTAWYEARLAQVTLLRDDGRRAEACQLLHGSRDRATSTGADQLNSRLSGMESEVCR